MKRIIKNIIPAAFIALTLGGLTSCVGDLDVDNINPQQVSTPDNDAVLNKIYANLIITGQKDPDAILQSPDIDRIDEGTSSFARELFYLNELPTDEALWIYPSDETDDLNYNRWSDTQIHPQGLYYRTMFGITLCNFYLSQVASDASTSEKRAEARFMRAYFYYYMMDLFGNPPMVTDMNTDKPKQATRQEAFNFVESELKNVLGEGDDKSDILADKPEAYGRASKAAANLLLARLYLNAEVYTGTAQWEKAKEYAKRVIDDSNWGLLRQGNGKYTAYQMLFMGDNDTNGAQKENILPALCDGATTRSYGGLFFVAGMTTATTNASYPTGSSEAWGGMLPKAQFISKFIPSGATALSVGTPDKVAKAAKDDRALFFTDGDRKASISDVSSNGASYLYIKFLALHSDGSAQHDGSGKFNDNDIPMMRVAEAYLTYAEADARINGGSCTLDGLTKLNALRTRANASSLTSADLDTILDEWSREFGWEMRRRMDLIRFGKFAGQSAYKWQWESGSEDGQAFDSHYNVYAIPATDRNANENLKQNPGY